MTEAHFTRLVLELAAVHGFSSAHFRPGRTARGGWRTPCQGNAAGWPDVFLARGGRRPRLVAAELKVGRGKVTAAQAAWLGVLGEAGVEVYVWTPAQWDEICATLGG